MAQRKTARKSSSKTRTSRPSTKKSASKKTKPGSKSTSSSKAGDREVTIDRRRADLGVEGQKSPAAGPKLERRQKVNRRRQIDPTTCERDYTNDEIEFMNALDDYKRKSGRMFPTCSEVLEVVRTLGYVKLSTADVAAGHHGSTSMSAGSATTNWSADEANGSEEQEEEALFAAALAD